MGTQKAKVVGYLRVSTQDQDLEKFRSEILRLANDKGLPGPVEWVEEKVSGSKDWRKRELGTLLNNLSKDEIKPLKRGHFVPAKIGQNEQVLTPEVSLVKREID